MRRTALVVLASAVCLGSSAAAQAELNVNINVGPPPVVLPAPGPIVVATPPPVVLPAPPRLVVVPDTRVYYAPEVGINLFVYDGRYYTFHDGGWFWASTHRGPWVALPVTYVPQPVLAVPVDYYRVPPGHARKMEHGHGQHGCSPGQAKQGRC